MRRRVAVIGQTGLRAHRCELRHHNFDLVLAVLVRPSFDLRQVRFNACLGMLVCVLPVLFISLRASLRSRSRNRPTSVTTPTACPVPRSLTLVGTAGLMSTQTIFTQAGSMFPTAMECSMELRHNTTPAPSQLCGVGILGLIHIGDRHRAADRRHAGCPRAQTAHSLSRIHT